jgi:hypothetical protein
VIREKRKAAQDGDLTIRPRRIRSYQALKLAIAGLLAARESTRVITEKNQQARAALARHLHESTIDFIG